MYRDASRLFPTLELSGFTPTLPPLGGSSLNVTGPQIDQYVGCDPTVIATNVDTAPRLPRGIHFLGDRPDKIRMGRAPKQKTYLSWREYFSRMGDEALAELARKYAVRTEGILLRWADTINEAFYEVLWGKREPLYSGDMRMFWIYVNNVITELEIYATPRLKAEQRALLDAGSYDSALKREVEILFQTYRFAEFVCQRLPTLETYLRSSGS